MILLVLFILIPIIEVALFIQAGDLIGIWNTIGLTILTAIIGSALLRSQGWAVYQKARSQIARDEFPFEQFFDGLCLFAAGLLLLTPGFFTDTVGFLLFTPPFRRFVFHWFKNNRDDILKNGFSSHTVFTYHMDQEQKNRNKTGARGSQTPPDRSIIEGEYKTIKTTDKKDQNNDR